MRDATYNFSSTHLDLPERLAENIVSWGKENLKDDDLFIISGEDHFGREDEAHITVLYGIHDKCPKNIENIVRGYGQIKVSLGSIDILPREKYDVVIINVESDNLELLHCALSDGMEYTNTYKKYIPHVTLGYVKKNFGWKHFGNNVFSSKTFMADYIVFSSTDGSKCKIPLCD